jgi:hypothetical protein
MIGIPSLIGYFRPHLEQTILSSFSVTSPRQAGQAKMSNKDLSITAGRFLFDKPQQTSFEAHIVTHLEYQILVW